MVWWFLKLQKFCDDNFFKKTYFSQFGEMERNKMITKKCQKMPKMPTFSLTDYAIEILCKIQLLDDKRKNGNKW